MRSNSDAVYMLGGLLLRLVAALLFVHAISCQAQRSIGVYCVSGDCQNGKGMREAVLSETLLMVYAGDFKDGVPNGYGRQRTFRNGRISIELSGQFQAGTLHGQGAARTFDQEGNLTVEETGKYVQGFLEGTGISKQYLEGRMAYVFEGQFSKGARNGPGAEYILTDGNMRRLSFRGIYQNDVRHGFGEEFNYFDDEGEGEVLRSGIWKDGQYEGPR